MSGWFMSWMLRQIQISNWKTDNNEISLNKIYSNFMDKINIFKFIAGQKLSNNKNKRIRYF